MATYLSFSEGALVSRPPRVRRSLPPPAAPAQLVLIEGGDLARRQRPVIAQELDEHLELLDFLDFLDLRRLGTRLQNVFFASTHLHNDLQQKDTCTEHFSEKHASK